MEHNGFPSDETLAAYIDGRLDPETRAKVVEHLTACDECYSIFISANEWKREQREAAEDGGAAVVRPQFGKRSWFAAGLLAAAAVIGIFFGGPLRDWFDRYSFNHRTGLSAVVTAANGELATRPFETRVSGGFDYRPAARITRGASAGTEEDYKLQAAAADVRREAGSHPTAQNQHALGITEMMLGDASAAVRAFESALTLESGQPDVRQAIATSRNARLLSDLAAAYYARGRREASAADLAAAILCADRAFALGDRSPEALWNRALAHESGGGEASAAWRDYLAVDPQSGWAEEARGRAARR
jgi:tetratricopeptide (TPR) repeat protein